MDTPRTPLSEHFQNLYAATGGYWRVALDELVAERDRFKALWDGTRHTAETLRAAVERGFVEFDYCYVCDQHPSSGHHASCLFAAVAPEDSTEPIEDRSHTDGNG